jgi:hypothetical protein
MCHQAPERPTMARKRKYAQGDADCTTDPRVPFNDSEVLDVSSAREHHQISRDVRHKIDLAVWLVEHGEDPAIKVRNSLH